MNGFLFDENLPRRLLLKPALPITFAAELGESASDTRLWNYAREHRLVIVTKDADFTARMMQSSPPPWVVQIRFGNLRLREFHALLARAWPSIEAFLPDNKLVCVYQDRIESFRD